MSRMQRRRRRILLISSLATVAVLLAVGVWLEQAGLLGLDAAGTMGSESRLGVGPVEAGWTGAVLAGDRDGAMDLAFQLSFEVFNPSAEDRVAEFDLIFSRDQTFDASEDCTVRRESVVVPGSGRTRVSLQNRAHVVDCLDAGPWYVAAHDLGADTWIEVPEPFRIQGGEGHFSLATLSAEVGASQALELGVSVSREAGNLGVAGLWEHPVDVWLKKGSDLCLVEVATVSLPRNPVTRAVGFWASEEIAVSIDPKQAKAVRSLGNYPDPFGSQAGYASRTAETTELGGPCSLSEGQWLVTAGPTSPEFRVVKKVFVHAAPVSIDQSPMIITVSEGEVGFAQRRASNPGGSDIRWSSRPSDGFGGDWMVGMENQRLRGGRSSDLRFTVSAQDLSAGRYNGEFVFAASDYYGTEVSIPIELVVLPSRNRAADSPSSEFAISNYPNPFNGRTTIQLDVGREGQFRLAVYDVQGREVRVVLDEWLPQGRREVAFDADNLPSGTYLYRLSGDGAAASGTMSLIR
jgi:hypothetical protein